MALPFSVYKFEDSIRAFQSSLTALTCHQPMVNKMSGKDKDIFSNPKRKNHPHCTSECNKDDFKSTIGDKPYPSLIIFTQVSQLTRYQWTS